MNKRIFKPTLSALCALLLFTSNSYAIKYFTVLVKISPKIAKTSYSQLMNKKTSIYDKNKKKTYKVKLNPLVKGTYKSFFSNIWKKSPVNIFEVQTPHFTLALGGEVITKNGKQYVRSNDGKTTVSLSKATTTVKNAINKHIKYYKNKFGKNNYKSKIGANLKNGVKFLYDPKNKTAKNVFVVQELSFGKPGKKHRLYTLGTTIIKELKKIGLNPKYPGFRPHVSIVNIFSPNPNIINKLKNLEKNKKSGLSKIFKKVSGTSNRFGIKEIVISVGTLKKSKDIKTYNLK
ncbi:hypothetical protein ACFLYU_03025 [Candidatus Dependentiae bacterium]